MNAVLDTLMKYPAIGWSVLGVILAAAICIVILFVLAFIQGREVQWWPPRIGTLGSSRRRKGGSGSEGVWVIKNYDLTMHHVITLIRQARRSIWTVRTHTGESSTEDPVFEALFKRVLDRKHRLQDVRRNIRIVDAANTIGHLENLVDGLADEAAVKVKCFAGVGPAFDFIIVDDARGVIGLPMDEAKGVHASIAIDDLLVINGLKAAYSDLWHRSAILFEGRGDIALLEREAIKKRIRCLAQEANLREEERHGLGSTQYPIPSVTRKDPTEAGREPAIGMSKTHVFLSYCRENAKEVAQLRDELLKMGEVVWWDQDILAGGDWKMDVRQSMKDSYAVVLCLSRETQERLISGIFPEVRDAISIYREYAPGSIFLIPVRLSNCDVPPIDIDDTRTLEGLQYVDLFPPAKREAGLQQLLRALRSAPSHP